MYGDQIGRRTPVVTGIAHNYFTDRTLKVMQLAKQAAQRSNRGYLDTGHVLLGLIEEGQGVAAIVLKNLGFDLQTTLAEVEKLWPNATEPVKADKLILTPETKKAIEMARDEACKLNHRYIGTESLLLGLLVEEEGTAARALVKLGRSLEEVREAVLTALGHSSAQAKLTNQEMDKLKIYLAGGAGQADKDVPALPGSMYDRFTDRARGVMQLANQQAKQFNHEYIGTEHILLGLVSEGSGVAANVLKNLDLDLESIRSEVGLLVQRGPDRVAADKLPWTPRAKKVVEFAMEEARKLNHNYVGTEHLLLGILREVDGIAAQVLMNLGLKLPKTRLEAEKLVPSGPDIVTMGRLPQTPRAKKVLMYAMEESRNLNHDYVGTEHILLGLLRDQEGVAAQVLMIRGLKLEEVRAEVTKLFAHGKELAGGGLRRTAGAVTGQSGGQEPASTSAVFDRFTDLARKVMKRANLEAQRLNHEYVSTEHVLLGLVAEGTGMAANVLMNLDVDLPKIRIEVERLVPSGSDMVTMGKIPQTRLARKLVEDSMEEACNLGHNYVGAEHILLGLLRGGKESRRRCS